VTDFDYIPIETTEGHRPPSPAADRLLIGLAGLALCGGLLIAAGNFLGADDEVSTASESPAASAQPSRTPRPTPSPRPRLELAVQPATLPSSSPQPSLFSGWIRASTDLVVRSDPRVDAREVGMLAAGTAAQVDEWSEEPPGELGWLYVNTPQPGGWVATLDGGTPVADRYGHASSVWGASVWAVAAGDEGFLAIGARGGRSDQISRPMAMVSADGARWRASNAPQEWLTGWSPSIAWGPAGWLSATMVEDSSWPAIWFSRSIDGRDWESLGVLEALPQDSWMGQLVASERGYLLFTSGQRSSLWFSVDGVTWQEGNETGLRGDAPLRTAATSIGFYAWRDDGWGMTTVEPAEAAFSTDGTTWSLVQGGPGGAARQIVSVGERILGMDPDPDSGEPRLWTGIRARSAIAWRRDTQRDAAFRDAAPSTLLSDGQRVLALGWDRSTEDPLVWELGPTGWTRSALPEAFGGIPRIAAAGPAGFVAVGSRQTLRGMNPIFWHETEGGAWAPERSPLLRVEPDPAPEECGPPPRDAIEFAVLDRVLAAACLGDQSITIRAWAARCEGCYGSGDGTYETEWLMGLTREQLYLSPVKDDSGGWWSPSPIHPSLEYDASWAGKWLEVTGHFDDPAASECRWTPSPEALWYYEGRRAAVDQCRQQFVVVEVSVVDGP
jgi:hypothetical protein